MKSEFICTHKLHINLIIDQNVYKCQIGSKISIIPNTLFLLLPIAYSTKVRWILMMFHTLRLQQDQNKLSALWKLLLRSSGRGVPGRRGATLEGWTAKEGLSEEGTSC